MSEQSVQLTTEERILGGISHLLGIKGNDFHYPWLGNQVEKFVSNH